MKNTPQIGQLPGWHRWLVLVAVAAAGFICARGSFDLSRFNGLLLLPAWVFFLGTLGLVVANLRAAFGAPQSTFTAGSWSRLALVAAIPVGFLASGLDCMGLALSGCTPICHFFIRIWTPMVAVAAVAYLVTGRRWLLSVLTLMCLVYLVPNCRCYNPPNAWWLHRFSLSPACFGASCWAAVMAIAALSWGRLVRAAAVASWLINAVLVGFFVGHHYYHFPW